MELKIASNRTEMKPELAILSSKFENVRIREHNAKFSTKNKLRAPKKTVPGVLENISSFGRKTVPSPSPELDRIPAIGEHHPFFSDSDMDKVNKYQHAEILSFMYWYNEVMGIVAEDDIAIRSSKARSWLMKIEEGAALTQPCSAKQEDEEISESDK